MEIRQFRKEQQDYSTAAADQSGEFRQFRKEQQDYAKAAAGEFRQFRKEQQEYAKAAAAQTTRLVEMMEGLAKRQEGLKQQKNNKETLHDQVVQSTENPKDEGQEETEESDWVEPFWKGWKFQCWHEQEKVFDDFVKYIRKKMEEAVQRDRLQQRESAGVQKQGTLDEYWPQREALIYLAGGLWRMKFEEFGKLHKHYDEKWQAVRYKYPSSVQATLKKQFFRQLRDVENKYRKLQRTAKKHLVK